MSKKLLYREAKIKRYKYSDGEEGCKVVLGYRLLGIFIPLAIVESEYGEMTEYRAEHYKHKWERVKTYLN
jgi:hypothetical protein